MRYVRGPQQPAVPEEKESQIHMAEEVLPVAPEERIRDRRALHKTKRPKSQDLARANEELLNALREEADIWRINCAVYETACSLSPRVPNRDPCVDMAQRRVKKMEAKILSARQQAGPSLPQSGDNQQENDPFKRSTSISRTPTKGDRSTEPTKNNNISQEKLLHARFLVIQRVDGLNFDKISPFGINKAFNGLVGELKQIKKTKQGLLVETVSAAQSGKLLTVNKLLDLPVSVLRHESLNVSKGVVYSRDLLCCSEQEILDELKSTGVIDVKRIKTKINGELQDTASHILTFNNSKLPKHIKAGYLNIPVRQYVPPPLRSRKKVVINTPKNISYAHATAALPETKENFNIKNLINELIPTLIKELKLVFVSKTEMIPSERCRRESASSIASEVPYEKRKRPPTNTGESSGGESSAFEPEFSDNKIKKPKGSPKGRPRKPPNNND
ncbi:unnamed protein product [Ceutorhynchus assimilis]|uniref:Uncharacterized protein n=1 Tax=Ceutorhynchus assimilis TaxID=467358 RepID=A0A9N9MEJ0_9CUCU|nr:unnamed protein product [Ceutorhynchus assimilis]